jgi:hypothetical protein
MKDIYDFYSKNLNKLDTEWKDFCFSYSKNVKEAGDMYYNEGDFWIFVEDKFKELENVQ